MRECATLQPAGRGGKTPDRCQPMIRDTATDRAAGFEIGPDFEAFAQRNDF